MAKKLFRKSGIVSCLGIILLLASGLAAPLAAQGAKSYKVYIISDTMLDKFVEAADGFKATLDKQLATVNAKASYTLFDTKLDPATVPGIIKAIQDGKPDLVCTINWPTSFADVNVALKLPEPQYRFVSLNAIPVQSGAAKTWQKPGGNITGVGVFLQFDSMIKVAKKLDPGLKRLYFFTWDAMKDLNEYFEQEIKAACLREKIQLAEFKRLASAEDQFEYLARIDQSGSGGMVIGGISVWVHKDGSPADMVVEEAAFLQKNIRHIPLYAYDETSLKAGGLPVGTCVVWYDIGSQLGEKGFKVLQGAKPGDLTWDYPRKYNLMFNTAVAKLIGLKIPDSLLTAAYRVYSDFEGHYVGQKN